MSPLPAGSDKRGTGRTTRTMERAVQIALTGRPVFVLFAGKGQEHQWWEVVREVANRPGVTLHLHGGYSKDEVNWGTLQLRTVSRPHSLLIDHAYIEHHYSNLLTALTAYDLPGGVAVPEARTALPPVRKRRLNLGGKNETD